MKKIFDFRDKKNERWLVIFFCFLLSFLLLILCSKCSFLYPFNGWDDFNSFYTIGSGWANGLIPYRDLFEQKGPFLYLIFMLGYLISPGKFIGIFFLEVIFLTGTLYFSSKIVDLFIDKKKRTYDRWLILVIYGLMLTTSISFVEGGSSEEFNLLFTTISIFYLLKYLKSDDLVNIKYKDLIICGLCCGLSLMIKYTTVGLWFIMMTYICIRLIRLGRFKEAIFKGLVFILMMFVPFGLFSLYFYVNDSLFDFLNTYFYINIFKYSNGGGILVGLIKSFKNILAAFFSNIPLVCIFYIIFCYYLRKITNFNYRFKFDKKKRTFGLMILFSLVVLYYNQQFWPYAITAMFFIILLVIIYLYRLFSEYKIFRFCCCGYIIFSLIFGVEYEYMMVDKKDVVQYRFAEIIKREENATLLQYRSIDEGFYTASGILPSNKYFEQVNIDSENLPDSYLEQDNIIRKKEVMFVVVRKYDMDRDGGYMDQTTNSKLGFNQKSSLEFINTYYELVDEYKNEVGYYNSCNYYLFKVRD